VKFVENQTKNLDFKIITLINFKRTLIVSMWSNGILRVLSGVNEIILVCQNSFSAVSEAKSRSAAIKRYKYIKS